MPATRDGMRLKDRTRDALREIGALTDRAVASFSEDVLKMSKALLREEIAQTEGSESTGKLEASLVVKHLGPRTYAVESTAENTRGHGYSAAQEFGWHGRDGKPVRGKGMIRRGTFGMIKRYRRGEKWRD